jgi:sporulation protein YlmC with PRC-barrel domain
MPVDYDPVTKQFEDEGRRETEWSVRRGDQGQRTGGRGPDRSQDRPSFGRPEYYSSETPSYRGRGPKGYRRSDEAIRDEVCDRLTQAGGVDATNIDVQAIQGQVFLDGNVGDRFQKRIAEDVAFSISGVTDVQNRLRIEEAPRRPGAEQERQPDLRHRIRPGMDVYDMNGQLVGRVKDVRSDDFLIDKRLARDVYVPFSSVREASDRITIRSDEPEIERKNVIPPWSI